jgi:chromosome segregation ATPase
MVTLEQVRQLETKIGTAIDYVNRVNGENARLRGELDGSEKRVAELEDMVQRFREEQGRIEEGILAALNRLDEFEDTVNKGLSNVQAVVAAAVPAVSGYAD